jgi:sulfite reductase (ferredoxin)
VFNEFLARFIDAKLVSSVFREIVEIARDNSSFNFLEKQETILDLSQAIVGLYEGMDDSLQFKPGENNALKTEIEVPSSGPAIARKKDFRGVACPMNFVKTKVELATLRSGDILEILLDNGEPIENVPGSIKAEGHDVLDIKQIEEYWQVSIRKR